MKFLKQLFHVDSDASPVERIATYAVPVGVLILLVWLFGSVAGIFHNDLTAKAAAASAFEKIIGWVLFIVAIVWGWANASDRVPFRINQAAATLLLVVLLAVSVLFLIGFDRAI